MDRLSAFTVLLLLALAGCTASPPSPPYPQEMNQELCSAAGGRWNGCGPPEACRDPRVDRVCPAVCVQYCECGSGIGMCPAGYACTSYVPIKDNDVGICKTA